MNDMKQAIIVLDDIRDRFDRAFDAATDMIYDSEGDTRHDWTLCDKIRLERVFNTISDAITGIDVIHMNVKGMS